jgi:hypothetical protein
MTPGEVEFGLEVIRRQFRDVLEPTAATALATARAQVRTSAAQSREVRRRGGMATWGFAIPPDDPLVFQRRVHAGIDLSSDLSCDLRWNDDPGQLVMQKVLLRIWAHEEHVIYRADLDAEAILDRLAVDQRRVMLRYHFDLANADQEGPQFHLQIGGNPRDNETCWLHGGISVPRLAHSPVDLVLACQVVLANFFPAEAERVQRDPTVRGAVRKSQTTHLLPYFQECVRVLERDDDLLAALWN